MNGQPRASKPVQTHPIKHVPQRMCVICRTTAAKRTLTRLVRVVDSTNADVFTVQIDPTGKRSGRGAYLCDQAACWQRASDSDVLAKALRMTLSEADRLILRTMMPASDSVTTGNSKSTHMAPTAPHTAAKR
jgi:hypothetical protein